MLEHTIFMLKNFYVTDTFVYGSDVCVIIALMAYLVVIGIVNNGIQSEDEKIINRCEFLVIISLIGYCILAILNLTFLPYSVPIYDWNELRIHRMMICSGFAGTLLIFVDIRFVIKKQLAKIIDENNKL